MTILGVVGSLRKSGNTDILIDHALLAAEQEGAQIKKIYLTDYKFSDCIGCQGCKNTFKCVVDDGMQEIYKEIENADGIILGSPTYFYNLTGVTKSFLDRLYVYEMFDESERSVWLSLNEITGIKYAATIAVCEQDNEHDMGFTSEAMNRALFAVGYRVVDSVKALHLFSKGEAKENSDAILRSTLAGKKLAKTIRLAQKVKNIVLDNQQ